LVFCPEPLPGSGKAQDAKDNVGYDAIIMVKNSFFIIVFWFEIK